MNFKKAFAVAATGAMLLTGIAFAQDATTAGIISQLSGLSATQLQAIIAALQTQSAPVASTGCTITANLKVGMSHAEVKCLQQKLNSNPATQVAITGAGSPGMETMYFGPATKAAVIKFQNMYAAEVLAPSGLTAGTGFVGAATRAKLNTLGASVLPPVDTTVPGDVTVPPTTTTEPPTTPVSTGAEGSITVTAYSSPASGLQLKENEFKAIAGFRIKAVGSNMTVKKLDLTFTDKVWRDVNTFALYDGETEIASIKAGSDTLDEISTGTYQLRFEGLDFRVDKGTSKILTIKAKINSTIRTTTTYTYSLPANGVRATDEAGLSQYNSTAISSRTFQVASAVVGKIEATLLPADKDQTASVSTQDVSADIAIGNLNLKAYNTGVLVKALNVKMRPFDSAGNATTTTNIITGVTLWDGATQIGAATVVGGATSEYVSFTDLPVRIEKDATKTLTLKVDTAKAGTATFPVGSYIDWQFDNSAYVASCSSLNDSGICTAEDDNLYSQTSMTLTGNLTGKKTYFYEKYPVLAFVSQSIVKKDNAGASATTSDTADTTLVFTVKAQGGDIYINTITEGVNGINATSTATNGDPSHANSTYTYSCQSGCDLNGTTQYIVRNGQTATFAISGLAVPKASQSTYYYTRMTSLVWDSTVDTHAQTMTWPDISTTFKTNAAYLTAR